MERGLRTRFASKVEEDIAFRFLASGNLPGFWCIAVGGSRGRCYEYWKSYTAKELAPSARMRRLILVQLLPKLSIGDRCTIEDSFLVVRGEIRPYRIHIGTGSPPDAIAY